MASYHDGLQQTKHRFESPAKVFAKLKFKVQREATCAREGVFSGITPPCNVSENHGADLNSPTQRTDSTWVIDNLKENRRGFYRKEVQAVTLSPISSPQKTFGESFLDTGNKSMGKMFPVTEIGCTFRTRHGHALTNRTFLESTAVSVVNREHILSEPTLDACKPNKTPMKIPPVQSDCLKCVFEMETAPQTDQMSPAKIYSPTKLRKRKCVQSHQGRTSPLLSDDDTHNNIAMEDLGGVRGFSSDRPEMKQFTQEPMFPTPRSMIKRGCFVAMEKIPISPAKMFAYMKKRESKREQREVHKVNSSPRELFIGGDFFQSQDKPLSTAQNKGQMGNRNFRSVTEAVVSIKPARVETPDTETDLSEDDMVPAVQLQPVLLEDPLVLNSPRISIPKKHHAVFKHNKLPLCEELPNESVIYIKQWFLRNNHKGLFVDGIHSGKNISWNSNIIMDRVSNSVVKTVSGRIYVLVGKMKTDVSSEFPKWFLNKFVHGFPLKWKELYEMFLSEPRDRGSRETEKYSEERNRIAKKKPEASSIDVSVQRHRQKSFNTSASCPPVSSTKVSRSGRTIKPPLEYWKGGRVILDAQMNVTIHECYNTSICVPEVTRTMSARKSRKTTSAFLPYSESHKQCNSVSEEEVSAPLRKVKASRRKCSQATSDPEERPCNPPEPTFETVSSPEKCSRRTRSSKRCPATERLVHLDTFIQKQRESEKASTRTLKKQSHNTNRPSVRGRKQTVSTSPESVIVNKTLQHKSSDDDFSMKRKTQRKEDNRKRRGRVLREPQQNHTSQSSESSEISDESRKTRRKRTRVAKTNNAAQTQRKCNRTSPPTKPSPNLTQASKKHKVKRGHIVVPQKQDEDEWTEAELIKLQEAVSYFPKHMGGYWEKVARLVGTRSAAECHHQHTSLESSQTPAKKARKSRKEEAPKVTDHHVISARAGTLKRKQQVRQFLEAMPKEDVDDIFSSAYMQNKRFEIPSMCPSDDHDFAMSDLEPLTPMSKVFPEVKTPQCLHITPGMMGSPNRNNGDKYVYQLQKRMKKNQFNVCKQAPTLKSFSPTPSVKRAMRRCGNTENDTFVVWEMFPGNEGVTYESSGEEDFYFSDND